MAASMQPITHARFLAFVTVPEVLAGPQRRSSPQAQAIVDAAIAILNERRGDLDPAEAGSLEGRLDDLKECSISQSSRSLAAGLDPDAIDGYQEGNIRTFLGRCYEVRSRWVHDAKAPNESELAQLTGSLFLLLRRMLIRRVDEQRSLWTLSGEGLTISAASLNN